MSSEVKLRMFVKLISTLYRSCIQTEKQCNT